MNEDLKNYARHTLQEGLAKCSPPQQDMFRRMYDHVNFEKGQLRPLNTVVDEMSDDQLDWAMQQVSETCKKNAIAARATDVAPKVKFEDVYGRD